MISIKTEHLSTSSQLYQRRQWQPAPVVLPGKSHGQRNLVGCSPWGPEELDTTERLQFHFSLSGIGEGNGSHSSVLAWRIPGMVEPGGLPSMGSHRVGHDWSDLAAAAGVSFMGFPGGASGKEPTCQCRRPKILRLGRFPGGGHGNPLQYSCLENPMDRGTWWATVPRFANSLTRMKRLSRHTGS